MQPQIVGFGAQKAGTTWLFSNLANNAGIWRPPLKEMHYFNHVQSGSSWMFKGHRLKLKAAREHAIAKGFNHRVSHIDRLTQLPMLSEKWYREAYRPCPPDKQSMDITPAYATLDDATMRYMVSLLGSEFKAIYLIRDPAARAISSVKGAITTGKIDEWLEMICARGTRLRSDYRSTVNRLDDILADRVLYLPFGLLKRDPVTLLRRVENHCGLPEGQYKEPERPKHASSLVAIPEGLHEAVRIVLAEQYKWLETRFDRETLNQI
ncbi:sulfotransferase [Paracoccus ravus]|uniref:sulfotransferase n=1 Tax=Paracoccus ravus TaxID=2447760 RepID=UPI00106E653C|nr:sulfotransferase [Paracoccus ravus]